MDSASLKKKHPQKYFLKTICKILFYLGTGECWYEKEPLSRNKRIFYYIWVATANIYAVLFLMNELLANFRSDLTYKEGNDLTRHSLGHPTIFVKVGILYAQKDRIKELLKKFLEANREYSCPELDRASVREAMKYCSVVCFNIFLAIFSALVDGIRVHVEEGIPIQTVVTYFPALSQSGILVNIVRFLAEFYWWFIVSVMAGVDCLCVSSLIFLSFKFKYLQMYFEGLREKFLRNCGKKSQEVLEAEFKNDFIIGIKLHEDVLWSVRNLQHALGNIYSVHILVTIILIVVCLVRFVNDERNVIVVASIFLYIAAVATIAGAYMVPAGNITHEASKLSTSMFHSGWELSRARKRLRPLVVVAMIRSQVPVYMTAFGVLKLSHANLLLVLRSAYSSFAVMY